MKNLRLSAIVLSLVLLVTSLGSKVIAQGNGQGQQKNKEAFCMGLPNITDDQKAKIEKLRTAHMKEANGIHNQLNEKRAKLNTLSDVDNTDMVAINKTIDEIGALQTDLMKKKTAHQMEVRKLLTDEQKVVFDSKPRMGKGKGNGQGKGKGCGNGKGNCNGAKCRNN